jgi:hypothetical protein
VLQWVDMTIDRRLEGLRVWQRLLDGVFRVPGTGIRFGWDAIIGLVPWVGDAVTALFGSVIIYYAHQMRVPRVVQLRMLINVVVDVVIGIVPFVGDVADVFWKSNARNFALLEHYAGTDRAVRSNDWLFVAAVLGAVLIVVLLPIVAAVWFLRRVGQW